MYKITDEQIDFILNDIGMRGGDMEQLQYDLLDHICCVIEQNLNDKDDFDVYYQEVIESFYIKELKEIETETIQLLTFKNYYAMQKTMFYSGAATVFFFICGAVFKTMHLPGANVLLISAIFTFGFVFLPLLFLSKAKGKIQVSEKLTFVVACLAGVMQSLSIAFHIQRWPYRELIWSGTLTFSFFIFVPLYFFNGIRNKATRNNTIITTVVIIGALGMQYAII